MVSERTKDVVIVAGPNGAGKTTWATRNLPLTLGISQFVNADEIARGLSPLDPEGNALAAGRLMLERLAELANAGHSFAFETTCSGRSHAVFKAMSRRRLPHNACVFVAAIRGNGSRAGGTPRKSGRSPDS